MKKILFIDRDGTIIIEPQPSQQVDSLEKLEFLPHAIQNLCKITTELDYVLVMVTNQDGLGTESFPEDTFWPAHNKMLLTLANENVRFDDILIDKSFPHENKPTRKPNTGLLTKYINGAYDLKNSYVIGDRLTDIELAKNLGAKSIYFSSTPPNRHAEHCHLITENWHGIYQFLRLPHRSFFISRQTKETTAKIGINLDGNGYSNIHTGIAFFDHMLEQLAKHSGIDLEIQVKGDLEVDEHHTIEDTAIALGEAFYQALSNKLGIERYGYCLPMDDCLAQVAIDFGGRNWIEWKAKFKREMIGKMPTEMFYHFFKSFSDSAKCNLYIKAEGKNEHHKIEAIFKAFAKSIKMSKKRDINHMILPSTKGIL